MEMEVKRYMKLRRGHENERPYTASNCTKTSNENIRSADTFYNSVDQNKRESGKLSSLFFSLNGLGMSRGVNRMENGMSRGQSLNNSTFRLS